MKRRTFLTGLPAARLARGAAARPPDVIFLMTDQQRWDALGVLNQRIRTPALDKLARNGILYRQATCQAPMCVPSRNSMMFGLYPSRIGIRTNSSPALQDDALPVPPLPELFRKAGYQTAGFGKTHWGRSKEPIGTRGFEVRVVGAREVGVERGATHWQDDENPSGLAAYRRETAKYGGGEEAVAGYVGCTSEVAERDHRDGWVAEKCVEFLDSGVDPGRPLFLYLSFLKPHAGLNAPGRFERLYRAGDMPAWPQPPWSEEPDTHLAYSDRAAPNHARRYREWRSAFANMTQTERNRTTLRYYANCSWLDHYFGIVMDRLRKLGRLDNALVVYTSDHGEMLGERNYRFTKYCLYESSVRVPLILSGSAVPRGLRGRTDDRPAELCDLYPTLARVAGVAPKAALPGADLLAPAVKSGSFCEYHDSGSPAYMWRNREWKLILFADRPIGELYDLRRDPHEWRNLFADPAHAAVRERMKTELARRLEEIWSS